VTGSGTPPPDADRPRIAPTLDPDLLDELVARALAEDVGGGDVTAEATVPADARATAEVFQKEPGVIYGLGLAAAAFLSLDPGARFVAEVEEGVWHGRGGPVLYVRGNARALLAAERTALNFLGRLSGIATLTARCVRAVEGTGARVLDTRKTTPGLRMLEKAAVHAGGGTNHRIGLYDEILIKENHAAAAGGVGAAVRAARAARGDLPLEVEVRDLQELDEALAAGATRVLLDNMELEQLRAAVARTAGRAWLEASGGATLETLREIALTGVDFISVGALTHSAPALDLSLLLEPIS
jgi:nicotinate-nucleotide pyrophosphorylase (carboxylating)